MFKFYQYVLLCLQYFKSVKNFKLPKILSSLSLSLSLSLSKLKLELIVFESNSKLKSNIAKRDGGHLKYDIYANTKGFDIFRIKSF